MSEPLSKPPVMIDEPDELDHLVRELAGQRMAAVDTESNSLFAYREQVCLIQISTIDQDFLVDPIALPDLSPLESFFENPGIEKIFHAAEYDIMCLKRDFNFEFNHIFDTMQAARILGYPNVGLADMLEVELGVKIEKKYQRANWGQRPLTQAMLAYARLDSHYLIELREILGKKLAEKELLDLAEEDFQRLTQVNAATSEFETPAWWRLPGSQTLASPQQTGALQALVEYRDQQARQVDLPHFKVLSNETLTQIAAELPLTWEALADVPSLSARNRERHAPGLLAAVKRGMVAPPPRRPSNHRRDDAELERLDALRCWRKEAAGRLGIDSDVVLPRDILEEIAHHNPANSQALQMIMQSVPWRFNRYGNQILAELHKKEQA